MTIVWPCPMTAHEYATAGRAARIPRPDCPGCAQPMIFFGFYMRPLRLGGEELRLLVRRARCQACRSTHGLLPDFVTAFRLDGVEIIGTAIASVVNGVTMRVAAAKVDVPYTTARDWFRRFRARADLLARGFLAATVALGDLIGQVPAGTTKAALFAIAALGGAARRRFGAPAGGDWSVANRVVGGHLLVSNTNPPWTVA
jgi:transposase-like protein